MHSTEEVLFERIKTLYGKVKKETEEKDVNLVLCSKNRCVVNIETVDFKKNIQFGGEENFRH